MASIQTAIELQDHFSGVLYGIIDSVNIAINSMADMHSSMSDSVSTAGFDRAREAIAQATATLERYNEAAASQSRQAVKQLQWESFDGLDVFTGTGVERFQQELQSANAMFARLRDAQNSITQTASGMTLLPSEAQTDISAVEEKLGRLQESFAQIENNPLNIGSDAANAGIERLRERLSGTLELQENLNVAMASGDLSQINAAYMRLSDNISNAERMVRDSFDNIPPVEIPVTWHSEAVDIFTTTGYDRFAQETASANAMLEQLSSTQDSIAKQAYNTSIFPPEAFQNLNSMAVRIDTIRQRIQQIESNPMNFGTDKANTELEQLRSQLAAAMSSQNELNAAMQDMDVSAANAAYLQLSQTIGNTERYIRDNVDEQGAFNQTISDGTRNADELMNKIQGFVGAYMGIRSIGDVINISDNFVQTTARLNMMNDGLQTTDELVNMVYAGAQSARGSMNDMADVVARFGNNAGSAFNSTAEVVAFAGLIQKQMTIAGASTQEASNAMLQLSQALGSGVLRGDELNSIFEQAPNLIQNIASYIQGNENVARQMADAIGVSYEEMSTNAMGHIRDVASEGLISADIVKAAIFTASDEINSNFEAMPMTWGQAWTKMQNAAMMAFRTVLQRINNTANSDTFNVLCDSAIKDMETLAAVAVNVFDFMASGAAFVADNWSVISPIVYGIVGALAVYAAYLGIVSAAEFAGKAAKVASCIASYAHAAATRTEASASAQATAAQMGLNTALLSCPIVWVAVGLIAIVAVIYAICTAIAKMTGVAASGFGVMTGGVNVAIQFFWNLLKVVANVFLGIENAAAAVGGNIKPAFFNSIADVRAWFFELLSDAITVVEGICAALNKLPFVSFDYSGITSAADEYAAKAAEILGSKGEYRSIGDAFSEGFSTFNAFDKGWVSEAFNAGAAWGDGIADKIDNFSFSDILGKTEIPDENQYDGMFSDAITNGIGDGIVSIADDTGAIKDSLDITQENLKYLRDIAEQETVNRFTTAEIHVDMSGMRNTVNSGDDIDGFVSKLTDAVNEAVDIMAEGVHE